MRRLLALFMLVVFANEGVAAKTSDTPAGASDVHGHVEIEGDASLTLEAVIRRTAQQEPGQAVVGARRDEAIALGREAGRLLAGAPALVAAHLNDGLWTDDGYRQWDAALELPLWWPGQRKGRRLTARAADAAAQHAGRAHLLEVAGWVRQAVAELALARVRLELADAEWRAEEKLAEQVGRAVELEELASGDLLLARSASLERQFIYLEAIEESHHAERSYLLLTGLSTWPVDWNENPGARSAFQDHPLLLIAAEETARAEGELKRLAGDQWGNPVFALGTQHEKEVKGADYNDRVVVGLRVPLGKRSGAHAEVAEARHAVAIARRDAFRLERELRERLAHAEHRLSLADKRVSTATEQAAMAAEYLRLTELGFGLGETDLGTLLRARHRSTAAEQTHREALILRQFGAAELNQALGVVP